LISVPPRDVFKPIFTCWHEPNVVPSLGNRWVFGDTAFAVARRKISFEAAPNDAVPGQTLDISDSRERRAIRSNVGLWGERQHATATCTREREARQMSTFMQERGGKKLTAFEIARRIDALPRAGTTTKDTARRPSRPHLRARAAANPPPFLLLVFRLARRTWIGRPAHAVADDIWELAFARRRIYRWVKGEPVCALESARVFILTDGGAVIWIMAIRLVGRRVDLRESQARAKHT